MLSVSSSGTYCAIAGLLHCVPLVPTGSCFAAGFLLTHFPAGFVVGMALALALDVAVPLCPPTFDKGVGGRVGGSPPTNEERLVWMVTAMPFPHFDWGFIYLFVYIYTHIYIYIERERERERYNNIFILRK